MDHKDLLKRYINWVREREGVTFLSDSRNSSYFSNEEWEELCRLDKEGEGEYEKWQAERMKSLSD